MTIQHVRKHRLESVYAILYGGSLPTTLRALASGRNALGWSAIEAWLDARLVLKATHEAERIAYRALIPTADTLRDWYGDAS